MRLRIARAIQQAKLGIVVSDGEAEKRCSVLCDKASAVVRFLLGGIKQRSYNLKSLNQ